MALEHVRLVCKSLLMNKWQLWTRMYLCIGKFGYQLNTFLDLEVFIELPMYWAPLNYITVMRFT